MNEPVIPDELSQEEFEHIYGRVAPLTLPGVAQLFDQAPFRWWICGGWSLELDATPRRQHEDVEVGIAREDLAAVRHWLADYHLWDIHAGTLTFLWPKVEVPDDHEQLWLRRDAQLALAYGPDAHAGRGRDVVLQARPACLAAV